MLSLLAWSLALALPGAFSLPQQDEPAPPRDLVLVQQVRVWDGSAAEHREDLLFRRGMPVQRAEHLDAALWPEAQLVTAEEDWILYPARIHAQLDAKLADAPANAYRSEASDAGSGPVPQMEYGDRAAFAAHLRAADLLDWKPEDGKDWREAGFAAAQVLPRRGLLQGRAAVIALSGLPLGDALLVRDGLEVRSLRAGNNGYPTTPMAALAVHRQLMTDAAWRAALGAQARPAPDLELGERPLWRARSAREVENLLDLMAAAPRGWLILGGREAWKHAERLKAAGVAVLYTLDLEDAPKSEADLGYDDADGRKWWQDPLALREERRREQRETVEDFLKLRASGVACALVPGGNAKAFGDDVKQLLDAGADPADLESALSTDVAALLGLPARGDAMISRGTLDPAKPKLAWLFADGRGFEFAAAKDGEQKGEGKPAEGGDRAGTGRHGAGAAPAGDPLALAGDWEISLQTPMGEQKFGCALDPAKGAVAVFDPEKAGDRQPGTDVKFEGAAVSFHFTVPEMDMEMSISLTLEGDKVSGTLESPFGPVPAVGVRTSGPSAAAGKGEAADDAAAGQEPAANEPRTGHPQWPVETVADRTPPSAWAQARGRSLLLKNGTLYRMDGSAPGVADVLIVDGLIREIGVGLSAPAEVPVVDAGGWHLMPAVMDAHSHLALDAVNEGAMSITAECRVGEMLHAGAVGTWRAAAGGTAVALALHGSANPIGGQAAVWELDYQAQSIAELLYPARPRHIKFALGENVKQSNDRGPATRFPASRVGVEAVYRRAFTAARDYAQRRDAAAAAGEPFRRDERLEVLAGILANEVRVQCHSYRADEIQMFLRICRDFGIEHPTFQHVLEGYKMASEIAAQGAMASTFSDWWAYKFEVHDAIPWNVEILHKAGVVVSINSDSDEMIRRLNTEAGKALRYGGLSYEDAMATCTRNSARQMHLEDHLGALKPGMDGTIAAYDAPPLSGYARCMLTLARGRVLYERNPAHDLRWQEYATAAQSFAQAGGATAAPAPAAPAAVPDSPWTRAGQGAAFVLTNARIHDMVQPPYRGSLYVEDGIIRAVVREGETIPAPRGMPLVDGAGLELYPGFINCGDVTGLFEIGAIRSARDDSEIGDFQPDLLAASAIHADSPHVAVTRTNGVAYVLVTPAGGMVRGQASLIQLDGVTSEDLVVEPRVGMLVDFPQAGKLDPKKGPEKPRDLAKLTRHFDDALAYGARMERLRASGRPAAERDLQLEALLPYARGEKPLLIEAADAPTIMAARAWASERGLQVIWLGARDAWKIAGYLGEDRARVITGSVHALPATENDPFDTPFRNAWVLRSAGCRVGLRTGDPEVTRNLPYQAATAAAFGLGPDEAARVLTLGAAEVLGVDGQIGSIEAGKVATFFLAAGDPLDFGVVKRMWIGGRETSLQNSQTELRERYLERVLTR